MDQLIAEKVEQGIALLGSHNTDCWVIFTQESGMECDQTYPLIMGELDIGGGVLVLDRHGRKTAIVSGLDRTLPQSTGVWDDIRVFTRNEPALQMLTDLLLERNPATIAVNYSRNNPMADGLTHGRYLNLLEALEGTPLAPRLMSAESLAAALRERKSPEEIKRITAAIGIADTVFERLRHYLKPGMPGRSIFEFVQRQITELGASCGWSRFNCPILTIGPVEYMGHTPPPSGLSVERGQLMQMDLGVRFDGYCSDFQRMFYFLREGETTPPESVQSLFAHVYMGISRMIDAIRPGVENHTVSRTGFDEITSQGFPEPVYSAGHQLGRAVHDGGTGLVNYHSPRPGKVIEQGNVFTVEGLETRLAPYGWVSLEENVVATEDGCRVLTNRQKEIYCIG